MIAIIPARGGSKRIPRKNIRDFCGKPIIAYSIEKAIACELFDEVMVSTEDEEIAKVARRYGAEVPFFRSSVNADDKATTVDVLSEVLNTYASMGKEHEQGCCIYPTAPMLKKQDLVKGYQKLQEGFEVVLPVVAFEYPIWRGLYLNDSQVEMIWPEYENSRSQDLPNSFHDAGQWYWFESRPLMTNQSLFSENIAGIPLNPIRVQDIDEEEDWQLAELKYEMMNERKE